MSVLRIASFTAALTLASCGDAGSERANKGAIGQATSNTVIA